MAFPLALPLALSVVGGAVNAFGRIRQGELNRRLAERDAVRLEREAVRLEQQALEDITYLRTPQQARRGTLRAGFAARGRRVGSATAVDTVLTQARLDEMNNARRWYQAELQAEERRFQSGVKRLEMKEARLQGILGGVGSLLSLAGRGLSSRGNTTTVD